MANPDLSSIRTQLTEMMPGLRARYGVSGFKVVGSRARGDNRPDSDLDLLVEFEHRGISLIGFCGLQIEIEDRLGLSVDLSEEEALRPRVRAEVLKDMVAV